MSDNFENVSIGLDILRDDIEALTYDYQIGMINSSLRETYFVGPFNTYTNSIDICLKLEKCDIESITDYLIKIINKKDYPNISLRE